MKYKLGYVAGTALIWFLFSYAATKLVFDLYYGREFLVDLSFVFILSTWRNIHKSAFYNKMAFKIIDEKIQEILEKLKK